MRPATRKIPVAGRRIHLGLRWRPHNTLSRRFETRAGGKTVVFLALSPVLVAPVENAFDAPMRDVKTLSSIHIQAPREVVWENIFRVPAIDPEEIGFGFVKAIGFRDPVEAALSHEGIGGVRRASFNGNLVFTEAIDVWEECRRISFTITPNTAEIPSATLDEHVIVGGDYTALWGHIIMADIQGRILEVIKRRCEGKEAA